MEKGRRSPALICPFVGSVRSVAGREPGAIAFALRAMKRNQLAFLLFFFDFFAMMFSIGVRKSVENYPLVRCSFHNAWRFAGQSKN